MPIRSTAASGDQIAEGEPEPLLLTLALHMTNITITSTDINLNTFKADYMLAQTSAFLPAPLSPIPEHHPTTHHHLYNHHPAANHHVYNNHIYTSLATIAATAMAPILAQPSFTLLVLYPRKSGTYFDMKYYTSSHIPLAEKVWGPYSCKFHSFTPYPEDSAYHLSCLMQWDSKDSYEQAKKDAGTKGVMDDVASGSFTNADAMFLEGTVAA
ncbi:uncharacterized protein AB675_1736 [Cyphellophora attinorum]|uniref:EthD domain-containing protein n=1 Tax=Cyphellophora attinorum TaxID=1664694 RepID=A0A0N0NPL9_9EURO|nr:uncharacterized protein AB675_1736 [Phialophora attinorum]KPI42699.1 hypothetical protein AB675_1736 [Phialophora attinorum]